MVGITLTHAIILLATGIGVGFISGLLGIGGGVIMTPVQHAIYMAMGLLGDVAIKLAFGTSLMVMLPAAISGVWRHGREGAVRWKTAVVMSSCSAIAAFIGATIATRLPEMVLRVAFGAVAITLGARMLVAREPKVEMEPRQNYWLLVALAVPIGILSGTIGVGGGGMMVPLLILVMKYRIHEAVATSLAGVIFISLGGTVGYIVNGLGIPNLPSYSIGYVNLPSWLLLAVTSVGMAQVGAISAHKLPARQIRYIFVAVLFYVGLRMFGLFDW